MADFGRLAGSRHRPPLVTHHEALLDVLVHTQDIAIPLGIRYQMPRLVCIAPRGRAAIEVAADEVARVEAEWEEHLGTRAMRQLRESLSRPRQVTDSYR